MMHLMLVKNTAWRSDGAEIVLSQVKCIHKQSGLTAGHKQGLPQLSALLGVPYCQLDSWLGSMSPSLPQLPQQWPSEEAEQESSQPELSRCSPSHAHQLISLAAFAAADSGKVSCISNNSFIVSWGSCLCSLPVDDHEKKPDDACSMSCVSVQHKCPMFTLLLSVSAAAEHPECCQQSSLQQFCMPSFLSMRCLVSNMPHHVCSKRALLILLALKLVPAPRLQDFWSQCCRNAAEPNTGSLDSHTLATTFTRRLAAVQTVFSSSCQQLVQQLKLGLDQMLLGSTLLAAVHLVSEPAAWLCFCILTWQHQFGVGGMAKKQGKKGKGGGLGDGLPLHQPELHLIREQLSHMQHAYCKGLQGIVDAINMRLKAAGKGQLATAIRAVLGDAGQGSDLVQALAGCLSWAEIQAVFDGVVTAQALTLKRVKLQAAELISAV